MNSCVLKGNLTRDVELSTTPNGVTVAKFSIAVQRRFTNADGEREVDFINCVAWRNTAEFVSKYFNKGSQILVRGEIQTRTYDAQDGTKRYVTEIIVDEVDFCGRADGGNAGEKKDFNPTNKDEQELTPIDDDNLPF